MEGFKDYLTSEGEILTFDFAGDRLEANGWSRGPAPDASDRTPVIGHDGSPPVLLLEIAKDDPTDSPLGNIECLNSPGEEFREVNSISDLSQSMTWKATDDVKGGPLDPVEVQKARAKEM